MEDNLKAEIKKIIADLIELDEFGDDERLVQELGIDSMMALEIVASIEKKYKIRIPEEKLPEIQTLNDSVQLTRDILAATV